MKKLIFSLIAGAVLIGIGIGVMMLEIAEYSMTDTYPFVADKPVQTFSFTDEEVFENAGDREVQVHAYLGEYFEDLGRFEVVEDKNVDGIEVIIHYRGTKPQFNFHSYGYDHRGYEYEYSLSAYSRDIMPKEILEAAEYMCNNKTIVRYQDMFYAEKVTIKTSKPDLIVISDY
ncbi:MAG: hypothetical protein IJ339_00985 [Oscillospiraceae bacterium]|nr:hypothetical protein [Oscillospiraceae bacterium]MBQ7815917.1 hypothetical protein [Oscillospiraceae bacterium]